ncbi:MAG: hypothetical protein V4547_16295 [Bacteroidota bacterium]
MNLTANIKLTSKPWTTLMRVRVGQTVSYLGLYYQNTSGRNSEPTDGGSLNWVKIDSKAVPYKQEIIYAGDDVIIEEGASVIFCTINDVPTFSFTQVGNTIEDLDVVTDDKINLYGTK